MRKNAQLLAFVWGIAQGDIMGFTEAVKTCFGKKYADFRGRASRSEYWFWTLFVFLIYLAGFAAFTLAKMVLGDIPAKIIFGILAVVGGLGIFVPALAVQARRLHDTNSSGWWLLIAFIPYLGGVIMTVWYCIKGTTGPNRFGPDPLNPDMVEAFD